MLFRSVGLIFFFFCSPVRKKCFAGRKKEEDPHGIRKELVRLAKKKKKKANEADMDRADPLSADPCSPSAAVATTGQQRDMFGCGDAA